MPMTVKVGLAKKVGQPDYGSLGASCDIELELDGGLLFHDLDGLQKKIQSAYVACRQAVNDELAGQRHPAESVTAETKPTGDSLHTGNESISHSRAQNGAYQPNRKQADHPTDRQRRAATSSQVRALHAIATRQGFNLTERLKDEFQLFRAEDLSISQASRLIDNLNGTGVSSGTNGSGGKA